MLIILFSFYLCVSFCLLVMTNCFYFQVEKKRRILLMTTFKQILVWCFNSLHWDVSVSTNNSPLLYLSLSLAPTLSPSLPIPLLSPANPFRSPELESLPPGWQKAILFTNALALIMNAVIRGRRQLVAATGCPIFLARSFHMNNNSWSSTDYGSPVHPATGRSRIIIW